MKPDISVLLASNDTTWQAFVTSLLSGASMNVDVATRGADVVRLAARGPDVVLLDLGLSDVEGYALCAELRRLHGDLLPIILTTTDRVDAHDRIAGLMIGADDYLVRPCDGAELLARVRRHLARAIALQQRERSAPGDFGLTRRELDVLQRLAAGHAPSDIAIQLGIRPKTVATHLQRTLTKMRVHSRVQAVAIAHARGLLAAPPDAMTA